MARIPKLSKEIKEKYLQVDNTFIQEKKSNPRDRIEVEIGDAKQPDTFLPQIKIKRWENEINFSVRYVDNEAGDPQIVTEGKLIKYKKPKVEFHAYDLDAGEVGEDGGLEIELLLKEKPDTNTFDFTIQTKELSFYYQPELTPEEIEEGAERPIDVVGSYAVYHASKGGMNRADGMEYKTGKAFHIYRPFAHDAEGNGVYGDLNIDEETGLLTVTIDQEFLNTAVYPVLVDPTFGYTSVGATGASLTVDKGIICKETLSEDGDISKLTIYAKQSGSVGAKGLIYDDDGTAGEPSTLKGVTNATTPGTTEGWVDYNFSAAVSLTSGDYYLGDVSGGSSHSTYLDLTTSGVYRYYATTGYASPQNPWPEGSDTHLNRKISIYATYTVPTPAMSTLTENFNDNSLDTAKWDSSVSNSATVREEGKVLIITPAASTDESIGSITSDVVYDLTGSSAKVQALWVADQTNCYTNMELILDASNYISIGVSWSGSVGQIEAFKVVAGSFTSLATATYVRATHLWWRIREASGTTYWEYSSDNSSWNTLHSVANPIAVTALKAKLTVREHTSDATPGVAIFDNFNTSADSFADADTLTENFNDNSLDAKWTSFTASSGSVAETNNQLELTTANSTVGSWAGIYSDDKFNMVGSSVFVEVPDATGGNTFLDLLVSVEELDSDNFIAIGVDTGTGMLQAVTVIGNVFILHDEIAYNATNHRWWQLREASGTFYWEYSADGTSWSELYSSAPTLPLEQMYVVMDDYQDDSSSPGTHIFDNLNTTGSEITQIINTRLSTSRFFGG